MTTWRTHVMTFRNAPIVNRRATCSRQAGRQKNQAEILILPLSWFGGDKPPFSISSHRPICPAASCRILLWSSLIASNFLTASFAITCVPKSRISMMIFE